MKHSHWLLFPLALAWAGAACAQDARQCAGIGDDSVAYRSHACYGAQADAGLLPLPGYADPPQRDGASAPSADPAPASAAPDAADAWTGAPATATYQQEPRQT
jgi:hypothetical protein